MQTVHFRAGDVILTEGEMGNTAYLLVDGDVEVTVGRDKPKLVATLHRGEVFGEMSLLEPGPRSATITASTDVECVLTTYEDFIAAIQDDPAQAVAFMQTLVRRLRQANELIATLDPHRRRLREVLSGLQGLVDIPDSNLRPENLIYLLW